ncbi:chemotaxis protein CheW [Aquisphaera insulae]|uniref:chemotaxis protein CheW n=1 Tax=Aquisphaera insulae TaxID=2712864 RepID=UPI0013ECB852|nr:chemotaxis protein CheW [Aquisphaera insulae]
MTTPASPSVRMFCTFRLDGRRFGFDVLDVKEITTRASTTRVHHAPDEVLGLVNIRGHVYLILDSRRLLGMPGDAGIDDGRLILFKPSVGGAFGVVVDEISDIRTVDAAQIEPFARADRDASVMSRSDLIDCVCKLDDELLVVLNPGRMLAVIEEPRQAAT